MAAPFAALLVEPWRERFLVWLALSAGAILLERLVKAQHDPQAAAYWEEEEPNHGMLRQQQTEMGASGQLVDGAEVGGSRIHDSNVVDFKKPQGSSSPLDPSLSAVPTTFEYLGRAAIIVRGAITGTMYRFAYSGARLVVDTGDAPSFPDTAELRRVTQAVHTKFSFAVAKSLESRRNSVLTNDKAHPSRWWPLAPEE
jgi:hypothetical protein